MQNSTKYTQGFSMIELSIVMVTVGLIVGGVIIGRELIHSSQINSVISDMSEYELAYRSFEMRYDALPGDFDAATSYWATSGNGNNNGQISWSAGESTRAWQHLNLSGMVQGVYTGTNEVVDASANPGGVLVSGTNAPASKLSRGVFALYYPALSGNYSGSTAGNYLELMSTNMSPDDAGRGVLRPVDAASIDTKMDDGVFNRGRIIGGLGSTNSAGGATPGCTVTNSAYFTSFSNQSDLSATCTLSYRME